MWKRSLGLALAVLLIATMGANVLAQGRQTGTLRGMAEDASGLVLPGVTVTVRSEALQGTRSTWTGVTGNYEIQGLPPGAYSVRFEMTGFAAVEETATVSLGNHVGHQRFDAAGVRRSRAGRGRGPTAARLD